MMLDGLILKGIGGFYYVETANGIYECTARGKFRKQRITPYAGDNVKIEAYDDMTGAVDEIYARKNDLIRPPVANIDRLFVVSSMKDPSPNLLIIDKTIAAAEMRGIHPVVVFTKADLSVDGTQTAEELKRVYEKAGIDCYIVSSATGDGVEDIRPLFNNRISVLTGNSGVGKSTLLNTVFPTFEIETGEISRKLGRGRHTTREVELYKIAENGYVADTPGFSTFEIEKYQMWDKDELIYGFSDFMNYFGQCKFTSCTHTCEAGCAILEAVKNGEIGKSRLNSYISMYNEVKDIKQWQKNKNA